MSLECEKDSRFRGLPWLFRLSRLPRLTPRAFRLRSALDVGAGFFERIDVRNQLIRREFCRLPTNFSSPVMPVRRFTFFRIASTSDKRTIACRVSEIPVHALNGITYGVLLVERHQVNLVGRLLSGQTCKLFAGILLVSYLTCASHANKRVVDRAQQNVLVRVNLALGINSELGLSNCRPERLLPLVRVVGQ